MSDLEHEHYVRGDALPDPCAWPGCPHGDMTFPFCTHPHCEEYHQVPTLPFSRLQWAVIGYFIGAIISAMIVCAVFLLPKVCSI